jgi:hypothetical protein
MRPLRARGIVCALLLGGCLGPASLHEAVLRYDETVSRLESEMLLLNIARTHHNLPSHFTVTSSIAATFDYRTNAGFTGTFPEPPENPTLSIVPVQGEDFTRRILTPMDETKFEFLAVQGAPIDMILRLLADGIEVQDREGRFERFVLNWPTRPAEYEEFRRRILHLAWLNADRKLFIGTLSVEDSTRVTLAGRPSAGDLLEALEKGYQLQPVGGADTRYEVTRTVPGRVTVTNYDPRRLTPAERRTLNARAAANPRNFVLVDIRPGDPGGDFPLFGAFKLRSLNMIIEFLAAGIGRAPERDVSPDPRTGSVARNPRRALGIDETDNRPSDAVISAAYAGKHYSVANTPWDRGAFRLLYRLFQMTVTDVSRVAVPGITIAK